MYMFVIDRIEENQERLGDAEGKCISAKLTASTLKISAYGLTNDGISSKSKKKKKKKRHPNQKTLTIFL